MRKACVTFEENGQIIYRNVEEKNQHGVAHHRDVKRHVVLDKTAERRRGESAGEGDGVQLLMYASDFSFTPNVPE